MKFKLLVLGLLLASGLATRVSAQTFGMGLEAGGNFSSFLGSLPVTSLSGVADYKLGFVGGGFICLNFGTSFAIRPEVLYEQKGAAISGTSTNIEMDYIEVPILLKFSLGNPKFNPALLVGPSFNLNTLASVSNGGSVNNIDSSDIGVVGGVELDIDKFLINARYELGLQNVQQNTNVQNGTFTLLVGYNFM